MSSSTLFQVLFQNETLFRLDTGLASPPKTIEEPVKELAKPTQPAPQPAVAEKPVAQSPIIKPAPPAPKFASLQHKILILADEPKQKELDKSESILLENILKAVGHSIENADLLNFSFLPGQDARQVFADKKTNFFITFGVPLIKLHLDFLLTPYTPKNVDGIWFLLADPLAVIEADRTLKKKLWQALQNMFEMS